MRTPSIRLVTGLVLGAAVFTTLIVPSRAQDMDFSKVTFKATKLAPNLHMIEGVGGFGGGNIAVAVAPDGLLIVDSSFPQLAEKLKGTLKQISPQPIKMIVNTHVHGDHTAGNIGIGKDAVVIGHQKTRERLIKDGFGEFGKAPPEVYPDLTLEDRVRLYFGDEELRVVVSPPAHTDTDVTVHFVKQNVVHLGDLFFNGMYPFIDLKTGGSVKGYIAAVEKALAELPADAKIIPGHGALATRKDLEAYVAMLKDTTATMEKAVAAGKSLDELKKSKPFAKYDARWAWDFMPAEGYVEQLYTGLKK